MKRKKIIYARTQFWFDLKSGGSVGHTLGILKGLKKAGHEIRIISNEAFLGINDFDHVIVSPKFKRPLGEFLYNFYSRKRFKDEIIRFKPDFIYHRYTGYTFFIADLCRRLKIPLVLEFNSSDIWKMRHWDRNNDFFYSLFQKGLRCKIIERIERFNLNIASLVVAVSEPLKKQLIDFSVPEKKILVNLNGVDLDKFKLSEIDVSLKRQLGIDENKILIGFSGTFGQWHGIPQLTKAISKIVDKRLLENIHFLLIGNGPLRKSCEDVIGHYENITFTGEVPYHDIQRYLNICDILLSPHNPQIDGREFFGSPTKLFEYMAVGKAIIASRLG